MAAKGIWTNYIIDYLNQNSKYEVYSISLELNINNLPMINNSTLIPTSTFT